MLINISVEFLAGTANIPQEELDALQALYFSTDGDNWYWDGDIGQWDFSTNNPTPCNDPVWQGLTCIVIEDQYYIQNIELYGYNLDGSIPSSIDDFNFLTYLNLGGNTLTGSIPEEVYGNTFLEYLYLHENQLTGTLSESIGSLTDLKYAYFWQNNLRERIPDSVYSLTNLLGYDLTDNRITGTISDNLGNLKLLEVFGVSQNDMYGSIPESIVELTQLSQLFLNENSFTGTLPHEIGTLKLLIYFYVADNKLSGTLYELNLFSNRMNGTFPVSLGTLPLLHALLLSYNELTGSLPDSLDGLESVVDLEMAYNHFTGSIPESVGKIPAVTTISLNNNIFTGTLPKFENTVLTELCLNNNKLTGSLPDEITKLPLMLILAVNNNHMNGTIPTDIGDLSVLIFLQLSFNHFSGSLPESIGDCVKLEQLILVENRFSGSLPSSVGSLVKLEQLYLSANRMNGTIPETIGNLGELVFFQINNNAFSGSLPSSMNLLSKCTHIIVENNFFTGLLPIFNPIVNYLNMYNNSFNGLVSDSFANNPLLLILDLGLNKFTGTLPEDLASLDHLLELNLEYNGFSGQLPDFYAPRLQLFVGEYNFFNGTIPLSLWSISSLILMSLQTNQLSGSLPEFSKSHILVISLNNNRMNGTIPKSIQNLHYMHYFGMYSNELSGSLPESLFHMKSLTKLELGNNSITGSIPANISTDCFISAIDLGYNLITGSVPMSLANCRHIYRLFLDNNQFSKSLPNNFEFTVMKELLLNDNTLTGTIPQSICNMEFMIEMILSINDFDGELPCPNGGFNNLKYLELTYNSFTGLIPLWPTIKAFIVAFDNNYFTGPGFDWLKPSPFLVYAFINNNLLTGTIPDHIGEFPLLNKLDISVNLLTGSIPTGLMNLSFLNIFYANSNGLTGSLNGVFNSTTQQHLTEVDVSTNQITGTLPREVFGCKMLKLFSAAVNCFQGSLPDNICDSHLLTGLALDGLAAATSCQLRFFPHSRKYKSYYLRSVFKGGIPSCLFNLPALETLHLSGNGLSGSLPNDLSVTDILTDLSLSHNQLTGTIPVAIQERQWSNLDLSYNKLNGDVRSFVDQTSNSSVSLEVNRLSGVIPNALQTMLNIDMLNGNLFSCNEERSDLPQHDNDQKTYQCGSNTLNTAMIVFVTLLIAFVCLLTFVYFKVWKSTVFEEWLQEVKKNVALNHFSKFLSNFRLFCNLLAAVFCVVLIPTYVLLALWYSTYVNTYGWAASAAYLEGLVASVVLFVMLVVIASLVVIWHHQTLARTDQCMMTGGTGNESENQTSRWLFSGIALLGFFLFGLNALIVTLVNVGYVYVDHNYDSSKVFAMQLFVVLFKQWWNANIVKTGIRRLKIGSLQGVEGQKLTAFLLSAVMIFNNIIAPFIATAVISSDCFYNVIEAPSTVTTSFPYFTCIATLTVDSNDDIEHDDADRIFCGSYYTTDATTSYVPPFFYSYQCSSSFITSYTEVYVYMFVLVAFVYPLWQGVLFWYAERFQPKGWTKKLLNKLQWRILRLVIFEEKSQLTGKEMFESDVFAAELVSALAILATFGAAFPPLAVVIAVAMNVRTFAMETLVGRMLLNDSGNICVTKRLEESGAILKNLYLHSATAIIPVVAAFYAFLLFDTMGSSSGWKGALWLPCTICGVTIAGWFLGKVIDKRRQVATEDRTISTDDSHL